MDLSSKFMGIKIDNPVIVSSSNNTGSVEKIKSFADAGAGAVVLKSLFEEQIVPNKQLLQKQDEMYFWYPEAVDFLDSFAVKEGVAEYLKLIENAKKSVSIPVFASINCVSPNEWPKFAAEIQNSGADGIELNIFIPPANLEITGYKIEETYIDILHEVRKNVSIPLAVKLGYHFTNLHRMLYKIGQMDVNSLVLFNRDFRPDIDIENLRLITNNIFSSPVEITLSLRWVALLYQKLKVELVAATGIHDAAGVIKQLLAGATSVQICSTIYKNGAGQISKILSGLEDWMKNKGYEKLDSFRGLIAKSDINTAAFERVQFIRKTSGML